MQQRAGETPYRSACRLSPPRPGCPNPPFRPRYDIYAGAGCSIPRSWRSLLTRLDECSGLGIVNDGRGDDLAAGFILEFSLVRSHKMNSLLKAMGFWVWGLIAVGL